MDRLRNLVLITYDSLRADHCSSYGYDRNTTPELDSLAADGVQYENAISPASRTNPSMSGIFTGSPLVVRDRISNNFHSKHHLKTATTFISKLNKGGYSTGAFCPNAYASRHYGFHSDFDYFEDFMFNSDSYQKIFNNMLDDSDLFTQVRNIRNFVRREEVFNTWDRYFDQIVDWATNVAEPFFLWNFALETHFPYLTPRRYRNWGGTFETYYYNWKRNRIMDKINPEISKKSIQKMIDIYDDSVLFADRLLYELSHKLEDYDPIFIIHADHGEAFNEHGMCGHYYPSLYEENVHVPLVVDGDGIQSDNISQPISLLNLGDIVLDLANGEFIPGKYAQNRVISTEFDGRHNTNHISIRTKQQKTIYKKSETDIRFEHYDLIHDPEEQCPLDEDRFNENERLIQGVEQRQEEIIAIRKAAQTINI